MPTKESATITTSILLSEDGKHRYLLHKQWDKSKKKAAVIMIAPAKADCVTMDFTTLYTLNNLYRLDFGSVDIINIFSLINAPIKNNPTFEGLTDAENDKQLQKSLKECDTVIIAWGKCGENNKKILKRQKEVYKLLEEHREKLFEIESESRNEIGLHPLAPQIRFFWGLVPFKIPTFEAEEKTAAKKGKSKKTVDQTASADEAEPPAQNDRGSETEENIPDGETSGSVAESA